MLRSPRPALENEPPLGLDPVIEVCKRDVDRTLLREPLRRSTGERVQRMVSSLRLATALRDERRLRRDSP